MGRFSRYLAVLVSVVVVSLVSTAGTLADGCQFVHIIDPDNHWVTVFPVGSTMAYKRYDLRDGGSNELTDVDFTRIPASSGSVSFVTQGHYLRVIDHNTGGVAGTIDVGELSGIEGLTLEGVAAADAVEVRYSDGSHGDQYALYLVGNEEGTPYYIVLDQEAVLAEGSGDQMLIASGELCVEGLQCRGTAVDIAVGSSSQDAADQVAFASVLGWNEQNNRQQQFFRVGRGDGASGPFTVTLEPWQRGVSWGGTRHRHLGVDISHDGALAAGAFQTEGELRDLESGASSCVLDGDPTDIVLWGPGEDPGLNIMQLFIYDHDGEPTLAASAWNTCPDSSSDPLSDETAAAEGPTAMSISSRQDNGFWVYVAGRDGVAVGVEYELVPGGEDGDAWELHRLGRIELADGGDCAGRGIELAIGAVDSSFASCPDTSTCPDKPFPPVPCCLDPQDPDPICDDCYSSDPGSSLLDPREAGFGFQH